MQNNMQCKKFRKKYFLNIFCIKLSLIINVHEDLRNNKSLASGLNKRHTYQFFPVFLRLLIPHSVIDWNLTFRNRLLLGAVIKDLLNLLLRLAHFLLAGILSPDQICQHLVQLHLFLVSSCWVHLQVNWCLAWVAWTEHIHTKLGTNDMMEPTLPFVEPFVLEYIPFVGLRYPA